MAIEKIIFKNGNIYEGDIVNGIPQGKGKMIFVDGSIHEGNIADGKFFGKGTFINPNGKIYECNYVNNIPEFGNDYYNDLAISKDELEQLLKSMNG